jgi:curved DNA-binding protein CbpA
MVDREPDPYQVLGIGADATSADIARAWRRLARAVHPDSRPADPAAAEQFQAAADAYGLLSDPARRAAWDHRHPQARYRHPRLPGSASPGLWPMPLTVQIWPEGSPVHGAELRAGPVIIQPPGSGQPTRPDSGPALARLLAWLLGPGSEQPW